MYTTFKTSPYRVFISFNWHYDRHYRYLLSAQVKNPKFQLDFDDATPDEIQSNDVGRIKAALTMKIRNATHSLFIIGARANELHWKRFEIGERNWQWWEIKKSIEEQKRLVVVKLERLYETPDPLFGVAAKWVYGFSVDEIQRAIEGY